MLRKILSKYYARLLIAIAVMLVYIRAMTLLFTWNLGQLLTFVVMLAGWTWLALYVARLIHTVRLATKMAQIVIETMKTNEEDEDGRD